MNLELEGGMLMNECLRTVCWWEYLDWGGSE